MPSVLIYHHLGLGDHIMCHGIVREYCNQYDQVTIFCYPHNYPTVSFMYRDLSNLSIIQSNDTEAQKYVLGQTQSKNSPYTKIKTIGFQNLDRTTGVPLEWQFYKAAHIPLEKKWDNFLIERDLEREGGLFNKVAPQGDYAFVHEDVPRHYIIKKALIDKKYAIVTPERTDTDNIIDYCTVIERASEVHVIDSSFMFLIDCLPYKNPNQKLYIHRYARENSEWQLPTLKKDWYIFIERHDRRESVKDLLQWISNSPLLGGALIKRIVRKVFRVMKWRMMRPKHPDLKVFIERHVPGKSFIAVSIDHENDTYVSAAQTTGAVSAHSSTVENAAPADVIFCADAFSQSSEPVAFLEKLKAITNETLILDTTRFNAETLEPMLKTVGFETREKHLFPSEVCFVCRATPTKEQS